MVVIHLHAWDALLSISMKLRNNAETGLRNVAIRDVRDPAGIE